MFSFRNKAVQASEWTMNLAYAVGLYQLVFRSRLESPLDCGMGNTLRRSEKHVHRAVYGGKREEKKL